MNIPGKKALILSTAVLAGCAGQKTLEEYPQDGFLAATQENLNGVATTLELFEAGTTNSSDCINNDIAQGVIDILNNSEKGREYFENGGETVDACLFVNEDSTIPVS